MIKALLKPNLTKIALFILLTLVTFLLIALIFHPETVNYTALVLIMIPVYVLSSFISRQLSPYPRLLRIAKWIVLVPAGLVILISAVSQFAPAEPPKDFLITHNFVDLSQVLRLSKYRACAGHQTIAQYTDEPVSNMQHYITIDPRIESSQMNIYAPFDGYVLADAPNTMADGITMIPGSGVPWWPFNQWRINFPHTRVLPEFENPPMQKVKAGALVGHATDPGYRRGTQVRVGVIAIPPMFKNGNGEPFKKLDSVFRYMTDDVFAEYQAAIPGLTSREDMIIPRSWREAHPCEFIDGGPYFAFSYASIEDIPPIDQDVYIGVRLDDLKGKQQKGMCDDPEDIATQPECSR